MTSADPNVGAGSAGNLEGGVSESNRSKRKALLVTGMHRSGTSALAQVLSILGARLSTNLMPAVEGVNDRGFFESQKIAELHEELLVRAGSAWDDPMPIRRDWFEGAEAQRIAKQIIEELEADFRDAPLFLVKDPRICRLVPLWLSILGTMSAEPHFLIAVRNPVEVAESLAKRDGFAPGKSMLLWLRHLMDAERDTRGYPRCLVPYEDLLADWQTTIGRIAEELRLPLVPASPEQAMAIDSCLDDTLRHHSRSTEELQVHPDVLEWVKRAYATTRASVKQGLVGLGPSLDALDAEMRQMDAAYGAVIRDAYASCAERHTEAVRLQHELWGVQAQLAQTQDQLGETQKHLGQVQELLGRTREQLGNVQTRLADTEAQRHILENRIAAIEASTSWRVTKPLRYLGHALASARRKLPALRAGMLRERSSTLPVGRPMPRLVVLLDDPAARREVGEIGSAHIVADDPGDYRPASLDFVHWPRDAQHRLGADHLRNAYLSLAAGAYDFALVSHALDPPPAVRVAGLSDNLVVSAAQLERLKAGEPVDPGSRGRLLRLLPGPEGRETPMTTLSELGLGQIAVRGQNLTVVAGQEEATVPPAVAVEGPVFRTEPDPSRPTILVLPMMFAVGGVERNTVEIMRRLRDQYRFVLVTTEPHTTGKGSLHHQLEGLAAAFFDLAEIAPAERHLDLLRVLASDYGADLLWICNGSPWLVRHAADLRQAFASTPIVDQEVYDTKEGWIAYYGRRGIRSFDRFIAINSKIRLAFIERFGIDEERIDLIYPALDENKFAKVEPEEGPAAKAFRASLGMPDGVPVFALVGRLTQQKRPLDFLDLARRCQAEGDPDVFLLIGNGELAGACDAYIQRYDLKNVRRLPHCDDMSRVYPALTGLVIVSEYEGLPVVSLEAMAMGLPVIATDVGDLREVFAEHGVGMIFSAIGDGDVLHRDFKAWRGRLPALRAIAAEAAPAVRERFSAASAAGLYKRCWDLAMAKARQ